MAKTWRFLLLLACLPAMASAFVAPNSKVSIRITSLSMSEETVDTSRPFFNKDTQKWEYTSPDQEPSAGYDVVGTLLRQGPKPWINRVFQNDDYEQAVLKFMASEGVDRNEAQGNMDAYLANPNDWAFNRLQAQRGAYAPDYVKLDKKQIVLSTIWGTAITFILARIAYSIATGTSFNDWS